MENLHDSKTHISAISSSDDYLTPQHSFNEEDAAHQRDSEFTDCTNNDNGEHSTSLHFYKQEWEHLFGKSNYLNELKNHAKRGEMSGCKFRSIAWRVFLDCLPEDRNEWLRKCADDRRRYETLKQKIMTNPRSTGSVVDLVKNNPLSQEENSAWNRYFVDTDFKVTIKQDVIRTFPEIEFFHKDSVRTMMINILFFYAREHPEIAYRQGMHELLAPLIFVLHSDQQIYLHAVSSSVHIKHTIKELLNPVFLEHDAYTMFCEVMETVEPWYLIKDVCPNKMDLVQQTPFARADLHPTNAILNKLTRIQNVLLKQHDVLLYQHLDKLEIIPQIYGIRWLRLMFGREFSLQELLIIWDAIFADSANFVLVDHIFVAMLIYIKDLLLAGDYAQCLTHLMHYPVLSDVHSIVKFAFHLREPMKYPKPSTGLVNVIQHATMPGGQVAESQKPPSREAMYQAATLPKSKQDQKRVSISHIATLTKKVPPARPRSLGVKQESVKRPGSAGSSAATGGKSSEPSDSTSAPPFGEYFRMSSSMSEAHDDEKSSNPVASGVETELRPLRGTGQDIDDMSRSWQVDSLPNGKAAVRSKLTDLDFVNYNNNQQKKMDDLQSMCTFCSQKLTVHIDRLQETVLRQKMDDQDDMLIALAGIKQVRDLLKGSLKFSSSLIDSEDLQVREDHYRAHKTHAAAASNPTTSPPKPDL